MATGPAGDDESAIFCPSCNRLACDAYYQRASPQGGRHQGSTGPQPGGPRLVPWLPANQSYPGALVVAPRTRCFDCRSSMARSCIGLVTDLRQLALRSPTR